MELITTLPPWLTAMLIFGLRVADVTLGTMRTVAIVEGRVRLSMLLGFWEVSIWVVAISQVISGLYESPWLLAGYASGFTAGNAVGILIERRLAFGFVVLRVVSKDGGTRIAEAFRERGQRATVFSGESNGSHVRLIYALCPRKELTALLSAARDLDPELFFVVERANQWGNAYTPAFEPTGWRAIWKRK